MAQRSKLKAHRSSLKAHSSKLLIIGLAILLAGAVMSYLKIEPYADYVLIAGALVIIVRGAFRARERDNQS